MNQTAKDNRIPRDVDTRQEEKRPEFQWSAPETLPTPEHRPGYVHRYIRVSADGQTDAPNFARARREGWEPVLAKDYPEIMAINDGSSRFKDNIEIGGLVLCRNAIETMKQRKEHYRKLTALQAQSVDQNLLKENDQRMPTLFNEKSTKVTFGTGGD